MAGVRQQRRPTFLDRKGRHMSIRAAFTAATALAMTFAAAPAFASNGNTPPGNPCAKGNGNPCNGNSGNSGQQGNAYRQAHTAIIIPVEPVDGRGAYITQLGDSNKVILRQASARGHATIHQEGDNTAASGTQDSRQNTVQGQRGL